MIDVPPLPEGLDQALHEHVFSRWDQEFLHTPAGRQDAQEVLVNCFYNALRFSVPWLQRRIELSASRIIEVGCGSGSSTAALAMYAREVVGFDIDESAVRQRI
jgi:S-adenosylmethionine-dependent methyltransferase